MVAAWLVGADSAAAARGLGKVGWEALAGMVTHRSQVAEGLAVAGQAVVGWKEAGLGAAGSGEAVMSMTEATGWVPLSSAAAWESAGLAAAKD